MQIRLIISSKVNVFLLQLFRCFDFGWFCCSLTSHLAILHLLVYSDRTVVQFSNLDVIFQRRIMTPVIILRGSLFVVTPAPKQWTARGLLRTKPTMTWARPKTSLCNIIAIRVCQESNPDLSINNPARYLYATTGGGGGALRCKILVLHNNVFTNHLFLHKSKF